MGSVCGPTVANIFVFHLENKWLSIYRPLYYKRFIDDLFVIYIDNNDFSIEQFRNSFLPLKLNIECENRINFLDLEISFNNLFKKIFFKLFIKKTNTFSYLLTSSNHPKHVFDNIPKSIFIRIKKNCSFSLDYYYYSTFIMKQLLICGYNYNHLIKVLHTVDNIKRETLIPYRDKQITQFVNENTILFKLPYDFNILHNNIKLNKLKNFFHDNYNFDLKIKFFNSIQNNLGSLIIHNLKYPKIVNFSNRICNKLNCETCNFISFDKFVVLNNGFKLPILCNGSCESKMAIYIIKCKLCNELYIGKTENRIEKRLKVHLSMIRNFFPFKYNCHSDIEHFNLKNHDYLKHFKFYIFKDNYSTSTELLLVERILINFVSKCHSTILNDYVPFLNKYDHNLLFN